MSRTEASGYIMRRMNEDQSTARSPSQKDTEPFVYQVKLRNYKSIGKCAVSLGRLTILVGRNGAGKSNFLDALRFVADGLQPSLDHAVKSRGGIDAVRRRSTGHPRNVAIELEMNLPDWRVATYGFEIAARPRGGFVVKREHLKVPKPGGDPDVAYVVEEGNIVKSSEPDMPPASPDRLYLVNAAGLPKLRGVYDALSAMGFYNLNPDAMKELQNPDVGELLHRDGSNIASVIARLGADKPDTKKRIKDYLATITPGITDVVRVALGPRETLEFRQKVVGADHPWKFYAASMSDGTLRSLGALLAVMQLANSTRPVSLVGIEEPETALHPAASSALVEALREAARHTQVVVTTHSSDLLDQIDPATDKLLAVQAQEGNTEIGPVDPASRESIDKHLYSPGELLRMDQLDPDRKEIERQAQLKLFESDEE